MYEERGATLGLDLLKKEGIKEDFKRNQALWSRLNRDSLSHQSLLLNLSLSSFLVRTSLLYLGRDQSSPGYARSWEMHLLFSTTI